MEDVLVKVDKFIFPADFVILDTKEDREVPMILGRPFLATIRTLIDVQKGELTMRVQDQEVTFKVFKAMKFPKGSNECFMVDIVDKCVDDKMSDRYFSDPRENTIVDSACGERRLLKLNKRGIKEERGQRIFKVNVQQIKHYWGRPINC